MKVITPIYLVALFLLNSVSIFGMQIPAAQGSNSNNAQGMPWLGGGKSKPVVMAALQLSDDESEDGPKDSKNIKCTICGEENRPIRIQSHMNKTHTNVATFACRRKRCNQWFEDDIQRREHENGAGKQGRCGFLNDKFIDKSKEPINGKIIDACKFNNIETEKNHCQFCMKQIAARAFKLHTQACAKKHGNGKVSPEMMKAPDLTVQSLSDTSSSSNSAQEALPQLVKDSFEEPPKKPNLRKRAPKKETDEMDVAAPEETTGDDLSPAVPFVIKKIGGNEKRLYLCNKCMPPKEFDHPERYQSHINSAHTHEKTFACPNKGCSERFETYWQMRAHSISKSACSFLNSLNFSKQHKSVLCSICGKPFKSPQALAVHMLTRTSKNQGKKNSYSGILNKGPSPEPSEQSMSDQSELPAPAQPSNAQPLATPVAVPIAPQIALYQPVDQGPNPFMQPQGLPFFDNEELVDLPTDGLSGMLTMPSNASIDLGIAEHGSGNSDPGARRSDPGIASPNSQIPLPNPIKDSDSPMFLAPAVEDGATHSAERNPFGSSGLFDSFVPKNDFGMDDLPPITNSSNNNGNANNAPHQLVDYSDEEEDELSEPDVASQNNGSTNSGGKTRPAQLMMKPKKSSDAAYYHCHHCKTNFDEIDQIKKHIKAEHPGELATYFEKIKLKKFPFECPHDACDFATRSKKLYENHMNNEHDSEKLSSDPSKRVAGVKRKLEEAEESTQPENSKVESCELPTVRNSKKQKLQS